MGNASYVNVAAGLTICLVVMLRLAALGVARRVQWAKASARLFSRRA
jgi:hypothetical protein